MSKKETSRRTDIWQKLYAITDGLGQRFPQGNNPFQMITRLAEETGELAEQVNHFERSGIKVQKHGEPDKKKLAKEVQDVLRSALQVARHYHVEADLEGAIEQSFQKLKKAGYIK